MIAAASHVGFRGIEQLPEGEYGYLVFFLRVFMPVLPGMKVAEDDVSSSGYSELFTGSYGWT